MPVSVTQANFKRGQPFVCKGCGRNLQTSKASIPLALAAFGFASILGKAFGLLAVVGVLIALAAYEWLTVRVRFAEDAQNTVQ